MSDNDLARKQCYRTHRVCWWLCSLYAVVAMMLWQAQANADSPQPVAYSTPPGITLVEVARKDPGQPLQVLWTRFGDEQGRTLFVSDKDIEPGVSHCIGECEQVFPPVVAPPGSQPTGAWSLVNRSGDVWQWAYRGKPLYRYARETRLNEVVDNLLAQQAAEPKPQPAELNQEAGATPLLPPPGWHVARYDPAAGMPMPGVVAVADLPAASGVALVTTSGLTLYYFAGNADEVRQSRKSPKDCWQPLAASEMANPIGPFSPLRGDGGNRQWAYRGAMLFTCREDVAPGDINGINQSGDPRWQIALLERHAMPAEAIVRHDQVYGAILSTAAGLPLYSRYTIERVLEKRTEDDGLYVNGKQLGTNGCDDKCLQTWRPLIAPADAQSRGFWEVIDRHDGIRQWAYKGFAQFSNVHDKANGAVAANNQYVYITGDAGRYPVADTLPAIHPMSTIAGFHWRVSDLYPR